MYGSEHYGTYKLIKTKNTKKEIIMSNNNNTYKTFFKGQEIDKELSKWLFISNVNENGKCYFTYTVINKLSGFQYSGKKQTEYPSTFRKYSGSGSIVNYFQRQDGLQNFEMHITGFYDSSVAARLAEATVVNDWYIHRKDVYNIAPGGNEKPASDTDAIYHCPKTLKQFNGYKTQEEKFKSFGFVRGISPKSLANNTLWSAAGRLATSIRTRKIKLIHEGQELTVKNEDVKSLLTDGAVFSSTRVWMHYPNPEKHYKRGETVTQPLTNNPQRILKMLTSGWEIGVPSKFAA